MKTDPETIGKVIADLPYDVGRIVDIVIVTPLMFLLWPLITASTWLSGRVFDPVQRRMRPLKHWFIRIDPEIEDAFTVLASLQASGVVVGYIVCLVIWPRQTLLITLGVVVAASLLGCWVSYWVDQHTEDEEK